MNAVKVGIDAQATLQPDSISVSRSIYHCHLPDTDTIVVFVFLVVEDFLFDCAIWETSCVFLQSFKGPNLISFFSGLAPLPTSPLGAPLPSSLLTSLELELVEDSSSPSSSPAAGLLTRLSRVA